MRPSSKNDKRTNVVAIVPDKPVPLEIIDDHPEFLPENEEGMIASIFLGVMELEKELKPPPSQRNVPKIRLFASYMRDLLITLERDCEKAAVRF